MPVFTLYTTVNHSLAIADIKDGSGRIFNYFIPGEGDGKFLQFARPLAIAQSGYTPATILTTDYINASIGIPIFSQPFKDALEADLANDLELIACTIKCRDQELTYYMGKIKTRLALVDEARSQYRQLTDGTPVLTKAVYYENFEQPFFIARDNKHPERWVVSEAFKQLVEGKGLKVGFS